MSADRCQQTVSTAGPAAVVTHVLSSSVQTPLHLTTDMRPQINNLTISVQAWTTARGEADFAKFAPVLEEWVALVKETSKLIDPSRPAYDVALEEFEKGMTSARIDEIFTQVQQSVVSALSGVES